MDVYINGSMTPYEEARIAHDDAGFQHGVGLFETMAAHHGRVFRLESHLRRLAASAEALGLRCDRNEAMLGDAVRQTLHHNELDEARIRLTFTPGRISLLRDDPAQRSDPTVLVVATPPVRYDPAFFEQGVMVLIARAATNPFDPAAGHKTLAYWQRLETLREAATVGAAEAIWLTVSNHLAGGAISNLFLVKNQTLLSPIARGEENSGALPAPVLPGITRSVVIDIAKTLQLPFECRMLDVNDLLEADEIFLTNSSWQILPVTRVEKKQITEGQVGVITQRLRAAVLERIEEETGS